MLFTGVRAKALSGSTPDYPDDEHETLCGCLCVRVCACRFVFVWPSRKGSANELLYCTWCVFLSVCLRLFSHYRQRNRIREILTAPVQQALEK